MAQSHVAVSIFLAAAALTACSRSEAADDAQPRPQGATADRIQIAVTGEGFVPSQARVRVGQPVTLVVTREVDKTCATDLVIKDYGVNKPLPLGQPVTVTFTPKTPGPIRYACAMDMVAGELVAE